MKLLDIIINTLRAMGDNFDSDFLVNISYNDLAEDDRYRDRVINILPALNRGLTRAYQLNYFAPKVVEASAITVANYMELSQLQDFGALIGVYNNNGEPITYECMGRFIIAVAADKLVYVPYVQIDISTPSDWNKDTLNYSIDISLANALPLYIKYELYQNDDANLAKAAKEDFDSLISRQAVQKPSQTVGKQSQVKLVYSCNG